MATLNAEMNAWLSARTLDEKKALLNTLAAEVAAKQKEKPYAIYDDAKRTVAYVVPGESEVPAEFQAWLDEPGVIEELRRRFGRPASEFISTEEFMSQLEESIDESQL